MADQPVLPPLLYKYRSLNVHTLGMIVTDQVYFASADEFNDPMDSRPAIHRDVGMDELESIARTLTQRAIADRMRRGAAVMMLEGERTAAWIADRSREQAQVKIDEWKESAQWDSDESTTPYWSLDPETVQIEVLRLSIAADLLQWRGKGLLCLAEQSNCPVMWSHYGDWHRGICLGYSFPEHPLHDGWIGKVSYDAPRRVRASDIAAMLADSDDSDEAGDRVDAAVFLRKAPRWSYEKEWRLIGNRGHQPSPLWLKEVCFGLKCRAEDQYVVMTALAESEVDIRFFEMVENRNSFDLQREEITLAHQKFGQIPWTQTKTQEQIKEMFNSDDGVPLLNGWKILTS